MSPIFLSIAGTAVAASLLAALVEHVRYRLITA